MTMRVVRISLLLAGLAAFSAGAGCAASARHQAAAPRDALAQGWTNYRLGEFRLAADAFEAARAGSPEGSEDHLQALYGLATTWNLRLPAQDQDKKLADQFYRRILEQGPTSALAPWTELALARMQHLVAVGEDPDYPAVRQSYQDLIRKYPGHLVAREAFIYLMAVKVSTFETNELKAAAAELQQFVADTRDRSFFQPAYSLLAVAYNSLGRQRERLDAEIASLEATEIDPSNPYNEFSWQYWNLATIAEFELGDFETARKYYRLLLEEYPRDRRIYGVKVALKRMDDLEAKLRAELGRGAAP
jgi:tetratricopeptide (TPR) repeat protein